MCCTNQKFPSDLKINECLSTLTIGIQFNIIGSGCGLLKFNKERACIPVTNLINTAIITQDGVVPSKEAIIQVNSTTAFSVKIESCQFHAGPALLNIYQNQRHGKKSKCEKNSGEKILIASIPFTVIDPNPPSQ